MKFLAKNVLLVFLTVFLLVTVALAAPPTQAERRELEKQLVEVEKKIAETEGIVEGYQEQGKTLKREIGRFDNDIYKTTLQIKAINLSINKLDGDIRANQGYVALTEDKLGIHKEALKKALRGIYEQESETVVEILLQSPSLSHFFSGVNGLLEIQEDLQDSLEETINIRDQLLNEKESLANSRSDKSNLRSSRSVAKRSLQNKKGEKKRILDVTKGQEAKYQEVLKESLKTAAQIRGRIFEFLGGGQLTFEQAYKLAKSAGDLTGMSPALILAVLDKESALGRNVGRCSYKTSMHPRRDIPVFLEITKELGINPDSVMVSCAISYDGAYGGAMGPAQFIPSTWKMYKNRIAKVTGNNPPSPWRNIDAFVGTSLYLKDAYSSRACVAYSKELPNQTRTLQERCAAAKYYAGSRWRRYRWTYGERVIKRARQFEADIRQISS
jgi:peptidoglycan hydrolase CwlO-like protein